MESHDSDTEIKWTYVKRFYLSHWKGENLADAIVFKGKAHIYME